MVMVGFLIFLGRLVILSAFPFFIQRLNCSSDISNTYTALFSIITIFFQPFINGVLSYKGHGSILLIKLYKVTLVPLNCLIICAFTTSIFLTMVVHIIRKVSLTYSGASASAITASIVPGPHFTRKVNVFKVTATLTATYTPTVNRFLVGGNFKLLCVISYNVVLFSLLLLTLLGAPGLGVRGRPFSFGSLVSGGTLPTSTITLIFLLACNTLRGCALGFTSSYSSVAISKNLCFAIVTVVLLVAEFSMKGITSGGNRTIFICAYGTSVFITLLTLTLFPGGTKFVISTMLSNCTFNKVRPSLRTVTMGVTPTGGHNTTGSAFLYTCSVNVKVKNNLTNIVVSCINCRGVFTIVSFTGVLSIILCILFKEGRPSSLACGVGRGGVWAGGRWYGRCIGGLLASVCADSVVFGGWVTRFVYTVFSCIRVMVYLGR